MLLLILTFVFIATSLSWYGVHKYLTSHRTDFARYNGIDTDKPVLYSWNNIGFSLLGDFRYDLMNNSRVKYYFFCVVIPVFPLGCYRVNEGLTTDLGRKGAFRESKTDYTIYGTEKWSALEVLSIYLIGIAGVSAFGIVVELCGLIFG